MIDFDYLWLHLRKEILEIKNKGPDNPTSQLLPIISKKCGSRDGEGRKDKGGGGGCV